MKNKQIDRHNRIVISVFLIVVLVLAILVVYGSTRDRMHRVMGGQGMVKFVLINSFATESDYLDAVQQYCKQADFCFLRFWVDSELIPSKLPMTVQQSNGVVASYTRNSSTGHNQFDCKPFGNPDEICVH